MKNLNMAEGGTIDKNVDLYNLQQSEVRGNSYCPAKTAIYQIMELHQEINCSNNTGCKYYKLVLQSNECIIIFEFDTDEALKKICSQYGWETEATFNRGLFDNLVLTTFEAEYWCNIPSQIDFDTIKQMVY